MFEYDPTRLTPTQMDALDREVERYYLHEVKEKEPCGRCQGKGILPHFVHVVGGVCFRCWGTGEKLTKSEQLVAAQIARNTLKAFQQ